MRNSLCRDGPFWWLGLCRSRKNKKGFYNYSTNAVTKKGSGCCFWGVKERILIMESKMKNKKRNSWLKFEKTVILIPFKDN